MKPRREARAKHRCLGAIALALAAGCGSSSGSGPSPTPGPAVPEARSGLARDTSPSLGSGDMASVVSGNNAFALELHKRLAEPGTNMMTSPYSISVALAMLWAGARGDTASQMARALHFGLPQEQLHPAFDALNLAAEAPVPCAASCAPFTLRIANVAWVQKGYPFVPAYLDTLAANYGAGLSLLDFAGAPDAARQTINDAVARATEGRIRDLLPRDCVDSLTRFVLTNAVYFKGDWATQFDPGATAPGSFHLLDGTLASVPFMHNGLEARATVQPGYDAVELPYRDSHFAMTLIAPKAGTFETFESALDLHGLEGVDAALTNERVALSMPKFSITWEKSLAASLEAMGMADAFDAGRADFAGITTAERLHVSFVVQRTLVAVDEHGTEAAAATAVGGSTGAAPAPPPLAVSLDRPFLFLIRDSTTGQILFLGRVVDPR